MGKIFPIFFGFISLTIPAGVVVYFAASNIWQIAQQAIMFRNKTAPSGDTKPPKPEPKAEPPKGAKPAVKPEPKPRPPSGRAQRPGGNGARSSRGGARSKGKPKRR
jgi:cell division protein FtsN